MGQPDIRLPANGQLPRRLSCVSSMPGLPSELSNYFLFDAMKTSELVKDERINTLIQENIRQVMGFNKYIQLEKICRRLLETAKANRMIVSKNNEPYPSPFYAKGNFKKLVVTLLKLRYHELEVAWESTSQVAKILGHEMMRGRNSCKHYSKIRVTHLI